MRFTPTWRLACWAARWREAAAEPAEKRFPVRATFHGFAWRTGHDQGMSFSSLGLSEPLRRAVAAWHHESPTPVRAAAVPAILKGGDVRVSARIVTGKSAAFAPPVVPKLAVEARPALAFSSRAPKPRGRGSF